MLQNLNTAVDTAARNVISPQARKHRSARLRAVAMNRNLALRASKEQHQPPPIPNRRDEPKKVHGIRRPAGLAAHLV